MLRLSSHNQRLHLLLRNLSSFASKTTIFKTSKHFIPSHLLPQTLSPEHFSTPSKRLLPSLSSKPIPKNHSFWLRTNGFSSLTSPSVSSPSPAYSQDLENQPSDTPSLQILKHKLKQLGIDITECVTGCENRLMCPSEKDTERILYGLDDIEDASDIIIVEGEMDKLAMEEAGFRNCVSVPDGAPPSVSKKKVPAEEQDRRYRYLWNCKEYLKKASRIILATDGDPRGQALAEELARRLGKERCWRVKWPKKNDVYHLNDANEVLMKLGPSVLKDVIDNAELYPIHG